MKNKIGDLAERENSIRNFIIGLQQFPDKFDEMGNKISSEIDISALLDAELTALESDYIDNNNPEAYLEALFLCSKFKHPFPIWMVHQLHIGLDRYFNFDVKTLDEAFGVSRKGMHLSAHKEYKKLGQDIFLACLYGDSVGATKEETWGVFADVHNISFDKAKNIYYHHLEQS